MMVMLLERNCGCVTYNSVNALRRIGYKRYRKTIIAPELRKLDENAFSADEVEVYRKFGGCLPVVLPDRHFLS